jgi:putative phosphoesterase
VRQGVAALEAAGADVFVHCGDVGGPEVLEELAHRGCWFVWGNTDAPWATWRPQIEALGLPWPDGPLELHLSGKRLAVYHGLERSLQEAVRSGKYDYVLHGHSHRCEDYRSRGTRVINPGALHRTSQPTVALLDLDTDELEFLPIEVVGG